MHKVYENIINNSFYKKIIIFLILLFLTGCSKPKIPPISKGEFSFYLEYEINGERKVMEDTLKCEYYIQFDESNGKSLQLKSEWEKDKSKYYLHTMHLIDDNLILQYIAPEDKFWMGEAFVEKYDLTIPKIEVVNKFTWEREQLKDEKDFAKYGLSILNYNCDPPIIQP